MIKDSEEVSDLDQSEKDRLAAASDGAGMSNPVDKDNAEDDDDEWSLSPRGGQHNNDDENSQLIKQELERGQDGRDSDDDGFDDGSKREGGGCDCEATALIVDDNALNLIPLEVILEGLGIIC